MSWNQRYWLAVAFVSAAAGAVASIFNVVAGITMAVVLAVGLAYGKPEIDTFFGPRRRRNG